MPEPKKAYGSSKPIHKDGAYFWYYKACKDAGTPIPNGPKPTIAKGDKIHMPISKPGSKPPARTNKPAETKPVDKKPAVKKAANKKPAAKKDEEKISADGTVTRATNLKLARECRPLMPEPKKAYGSS
mmetsp:Transcript_6396/g.7651  ORF Transcript_6396/g.7651 Transcript_6396/m.7651 type:complete len:128 (+) Transcript_6396:1-384(+)